ncbi:MAG TPA: hypothetical protein VGH43_03180 [Jatrophihabitans sp.]|jgi:uncharacterized protein YegL
MSDRLGGAVGRRPLHFIWLLDVSGSMAVGGKIQALNTAIEETLPQLREDARDHPQAEILMRAMTFATTTSWLQRRPVPVEQFRWDPVGAVPQGLTELGAAILALVDPMRELAEVGRGFAPVIVLVSDGKPTHTAGPTTADAIPVLLAEPWGRASVRMAVGIGEDADMEALSTFIAHPDRTPLRAANPSDLVAMIQWVSRQGSRVASLATGRDGASVGMPVSSGPVWDASTT